MSAWEREPGTLPSPICPCSTERPGRDLLFLVIVLVLLLLALVIENIEFEDDDENEDEDDKEQKFLLRWPKTHHNLD
jgi:hypothetical protein